MAYKRAQFEELMQRMDEPRAFIQVVTGPRQVGKSTLVGQVLDELKKPHLLYSADTIASTNPAWISECWQIARMQYKSKGYGELVLAIDEIQKLHNWSEYVKKEWDADTMSRLNIKVILLGSSRVMMVKGLAESLMGRYEEIRMGHWGLKEMEAAFGWSMEQYVYFGGYPGAANLIKNEERWRNYISGSMVDATINKDILMDTPVGKPALLRQTFELSVAYSGKILSLTKMLGSLQDAGNTVTLASYLNLLGDCGLVRGLQKYSEDASRKRASIPKYQVFNNALLSTYGGLSFRQATNDSKRWGQYFESAVGAHIVNEAFLHRFEVGYWRDGNDEVDFVLRKNQRVVAVEVKSNGEARTAGLQRFQALFHPHAAFVVGDNGFAPEDFLSLSLNELF